MKSLAWVITAAIAMSTAAAFAAEKKDDIEAIKAELKPLRMEAYKEPDVMKARKKLDAAYKAYWDTVRTAMLRLDPSKAALIEKDMAYRQDAGAISKNVDKK